MIVRLDLAEQVDVLVVRGIFSRCGIDEETAAAATVSGEEEAGVRKRAME